MTRYDEHTALVVVDVQNDFADPMGSLYVSGGEEVVAFANREIGAALAQRAPVVYTQDWHPPSTPHFAKDGGIWPVHCVRDTWGSELHPDLEMAGSVVRKGTEGEDGYSGFTMRHPETAETRATELERILQEHGIDTVVVVGLATDYCVKETALDAVLRGFWAVVLRDGIRAVDREPGDGDRALDELQRAGVEVV